MVRPTLLLIILGSLSLSHTHPGESLEDVQTDAKIRADYLKKLKPHRRIKSCTTPNSLLSKQQSDERREQLFRTLRGEHSIEPGNPKSLHTEVAIEEVNGPLQSIKSFIADAKSGYYGSWRSDHKHDLSKLAFSRNDPMAGKLPRLDWGSYNLGNTLVLSPTVGAGPFCKQRKS